jgi:hypothetical protein
LLVLNRSLLNREYILINVLKALTSIISMCNLRHGRHSRHLSSTVACVFTAMLSINVHPIGLAHLSGMVWTGSLPSNGHIRHNIFLDTYSTYNMINNY